MLGQRKSALREPKTTISAEETGWKGYGLLMITDQRSSELGVESFAPQVCHRQCSTHSQIPLVMRIYREGVYRQKVIPPLLRYGQDSPPISFPLSADHCLITLVQYNVVRAMLYNMSILSMMDHFPQQCGRSLRIPCFGSITPERIPLDLQPTPMQESVPHAFWINAIPFPRLRDNLIIMSGKYDSDGLLYDLGQGLYEGFDDPERRGFLVWGDPWRADGWEVSEGFAGKWGWMLAGCMDVMEFTNRWRDIRGEEKLVLEAAESNGSNEQF